MTVEKTIRILLVDDHALFRRGLTSLLSADERFEVVGQAGDAGEAYRRAAETQPDLILLDNHLPGVLGVDALPGLRQAAPNARVMMLTMSEDEQDLAAALRGGARGYLLKTIESEEMTTAILRTMEGHSTVSPEMTSKLVTAFQTLNEVQSVGENNQEPPPSLSPREEQILAQIAKGKTNKEIARQLSIAEPTVKIHVQHILRKLNLGSRVQAAAYAAARAS